MHNTRLIDHRVSRRASVRGGNSNHADSSIETVSSVACRAEKLPESCESVAKYARKRKANSSKPSSSVKRRRKNSSAGDDALMKNGSQTGDFRSSSNASLNQPTASDGHHGRHRRRTATGCLEFSSKSRRLASALQCGDAGNESRQ